MKRGESAFSTVIELVIAAAIVMVVGSVAASVISGSAVEESFLATEGKLLVETMAFLPGDSFVNAEPNASPVLFTVHAGSLYVSDSNVKYNPRDFKPRTQAPLDIPSWVSFSTVDESFNELYLAKEGDVLRFEGSPVGSIYSCPDLDTSKPAGEVRVFVDTSLALRQGLEGMLSDFNVTGENPDLVIKITGRSDKKVWFSPSAKGLKLGCELAKSLPGYIHQSNDALGGFTVEVFVNASKMGERSYRGELQSVISGAVRRFYS